MSRRRPKLRIVPDLPAAKARKASPVPTIVSGVLAGLAAAAALKRYLSRLRARNNSDEVGVLTAEVSSNGHSKARLGSLDSFS